VSAITWERSPDRSVWVAQVPGSGTLFTVSRTSGGGWVPAEGTGRRGAVCRTRLEAQHWAEKAAEAAP
jgi:hypothetical protein